MKLIFLIIIAFISIGPKNQTGCPGWNQYHLFTDIFKRQFLIRLYDNFVMYMRNNTEISKSTHCIHKNIPACCLNDIFHELGAVAFEPFPFFRAANSLICNGFAAEDFFSDSRLDVGKTSAGGQGYKEKDALIIKPIRSVKHLGCIISEGAHVIANIYPHVLMYLIHRLVEFKSGVSVDVIE
jgi:hypothetical protein